MHWNDTQKVPYATSASQWIGYDNEKSIKYKLDFLLERKLGGGMIWSIDTDDFSGHCGVKYPLLKEISRVLNKGRRSMSTVNKLLQFAKTNLFVCTS